jgi:hypothetical protein
MTVGVSSSTNNKFSAFVSAESGRYFSIISLNQKKQQRITDNEQQEQEQD